MKNYLLQRLLLLPITLFAIVLINFIILNLAPLEPITGLNRSSQDEASKSVDAQEGVYEEQYLHFREHYGLTLPVLLNTWSTLSLKDAKNALEELLRLKENSFTEYREKYIRFGDKARFIMPFLLQIAQDPQEDVATRRMALNLFIRGGTRQGHVGPTISEKQKEENKEIGISNAFLFMRKATFADNEETLHTKTQELQKWLNIHSTLYPKHYSFLDKVEIFFIETRFCRYITKVATLDFGTLRKDQNKLVIDEVIKRLKISFSLSLAPLFFSFFAALCLGMVMAIYQNRLLDITLNTFFLILFTIPVFVVAPFLIEKFALHKHLAFTNIPMPLGGFHSEEKIYIHMNSLQRLGDILLHLALPLIAILYGSMAIQARLSRTAILHVLRQDHVKTAFAKGLPLSTILVRHVGKNAAIPLVTSLASSLGAILGGALIVETVFEINGFGRFFYDAIVNRDYNVILFSAFAGSLLTLIGYLLADVAYTLLDPRVGYEKQEN